MPVSIPAGAHCAASRQTLCKARQRILARSRPLARIFDERRFPATLACLTANLASFGFSWDSLPFSGGISDPRGMDTKTRIAELLSRAEDAASHVNALIDALRAAEDMRDDGECIDSVKGSISDAENELFYLEGACADLREVFEGD